MSQKWYKDILSREGENKPKSFCDYDFQTNRVINHRIADIFNTTENERQANDTDIPGDYNITAKQIENYSELNAGEKY